MAASDDNSSNNLEDTAMKLPPFTEIKADGHYRYRRRVPKPLVAYWVRSASIATSARPMILL